MKLAAYLALAATMALGLSHPAAALAQNLAPVHAEELANPPIEAGAKILVLLATNDKKGIDKRIGDLPQLKEPPFSSYDSYTLLQEGVLPLKEGEERTFDVDANSSKLMLRLKGKNRARYSLDTEVRKGDGKRFVAAQVEAKDGEYFFIAGPRHNGGILVFGIRIKAK